MKSWWLIYCRPKKHQLLFTSPKNKNSQKGCTLLPYYGNAVGAAGRAAPNKRRWAASFSLLPFGSHTGSGYGRRSRLTTCYTLFTLTKPYGVFGWF